MKPALDYADGPLPLPAIRRIAADRPVRWLRAGWHDLKANPLPSLAYGLLFALAGDLIILATLDRPHLLTVSISGFFLIAPLLAAGLNELSRRTAAGEKILFIDSVRCFKRNGESLALFGLILAWVLVRYSFPGRRLVDALIDLPFAMPTAVSGIALCAIFAPNGWIGQWVAPFGIELAYNPIGVVIALTFIGLPFVVRTLQPVLREAETEQEEAAASLGANRWQTFARVLWPTLIPALLTGFALAFARGVGEYGSVIFIAGNLPMVSEIAPLMIMSHLEEYDYAGASAIASVMLLISFVLLLIINKLQAWSWARIGGSRI